jgi:hypothetical protein
LSKLSNLTSFWFRQARRIFHILVGLVFFFLAFAGGVVSFSEWQYYRRAPSIGLARFGLLAGFTVLLIIFGLYSLAKARSVR